MPFLLRMRLQKLQNLLMVASRWQSVRRLSVFPAVPACSSTSFATLISTRNVRFIMSSMSSTCAGMLTSFRVHPLSSWCIISKPGSCGTNSSMSVIMFVFL